MGQHTGADPAGQPLDQSPAGLLARGRDTLAAQPSSRWLGALLHPLSPAWRERHAPLAASLQQQVGFAHGEVLCHAADSVLTFAGSATLQIRVSESKVNCARLAIGEHPIARAQVVHAGRTQAVCRCEVLVPNGGEEKLGAGVHRTVAALSPAPGSSA